MVIVNLVNRSPLSLWLRLLSLVLFSCPLDNWCRVRGWPRPWFLLSVAHSVRWERKAWHRGVHNVLFVRQKTYSVRKRILVGWILHPGVYTCTWGCEGGYYPSHGWSSLAPRRQTEILHPPRQPPRTHSPNWHLTPHLAKLEALTPS